MGCLLALLLLFGFGFFAASESSSLSRASTASAVSIEAASTAAYLDATGVSITRFASARATDSDGCPVDETSTFRRSEAISVFAIGAFPRNTTVFARMYYDGVPVEDTDTLTADQDYDDVCVYFTFEPTTGAEVFDRGPYMVEFIVNGVAVGSIDLVVE